MKRKIHLNMILLAAAGVILTAAAVYAVIYLEPQIAFSGLALIAGMISLLLIIILSAAAGGLSERIVKPLRGSASDMSKLAVYDEFVPLIMALNARQEQIEAQYQTLRERSESNNTIIRSMSEGAVLLDSRGAILTANDSALAIFEATAPMEGRNVIELFREYELLEAVKTALNGERGEVRVSRGGREYIAYLSPVTAGGTILLLLDVTEKAAAEQLRREFTANVSHELKTPLTAISGYAEMLSSGMAAEKDKDMFLRRIRDESARLIALIQDIMLLSRLDEGGAERTFEPVNLASVARTEAEALASYAAEAKVSISVQDANLTVSGNRTLLAELFHNLIENAVKYNNPGGSVAVTFGEGSATVSDTGVGIPKEAQGRVFERFYRAEGSRSKKTGGTGLGLAIVKHVAAIHGATVSLESSEGAGTSVTVRFI